ncbi:hypothetical protein BTJ40_06055 [Microbulbifer sp. A4B17]|uniref:DUF4124 domain-containing protein n=1 Tax=Microbulbifer sp. A4B17 TaxID=359370 RepID=UPI000D52CF85|nr:hypothetical protein [Microbulbifer sp. A4B17]AWF80407.1 hypothetical protein BTJ40_06055 [Microbulbifer sp. A4B17]
MKYFPMLGALLLVGVVLPMVLPGPDGKPIMSPSDWLPQKPDISAIRETGERAVQSMRKTTQESVSKIEELATSSGLIPQEDSARQTSEVFTWKDKDGNWHFSDNVPEGLDSHVRIHRVKPLNTVTANDPIELKTDSVDQGSSTSTNELPTHHTSLSKLLEDTKAIEQKSLERQKVLDSL